MGILDFIFGPAVPPIGGPDELRAALFEAALGGQEKVFRKLCRRHREFIVRHFKEWQKVPEAVRADRGALDRYVRGIVAVARHFAEVLGIPDLLESLQGDPKDNPLTPWEERVRKASSLMEGAQYDEAVALLEDALIDSRGLQGSAPDTWRAVSLELLGECWFHSGQAGRAAEPIRQALRLCESVGVADGRGRCLESLYEVERYLGRTGEAADLADRLARLAAEDGRSKDARVWRRQADLVRAGEPLNRVVVRVGKDWHEIDDLPPVREGQFEFVFRRNRVPLGLAAHHLGKGQEAGSAGRFEEALDEFRTAARIDPRDPHPPYQAAVALMHLRRASDAVESLELTEKLAPGWFQCRADLWLAEQVASEALPGEVFDVLRGLEDGRLPPGEAIRLVEAALGKWPDVPAFHLHLGRNLFREGRKDEAVRYFRAGLALSPDRDVEARLRVDLAMAIRGGEGARLLEEVVREKGNLAAAAQAVLMLKSGTLA